MNQQVKVLNAAAVSQRPRIQHASFEETHHRESDGVSTTIKDNWRTRANNKVKVVICSK